MPIFGQSLPKKWAWGGCLNLGHAEKSRLVKCPAGAIAEKTRLKSVFPLAVSLRIELPRKFDAFAWQSPSGLALGQIISYPL